MGTAESHGIELEYRRSHQFIDFSLDLTRPLPDLWLALGEAASKIEHVRGALLKPQTALRLQTTFMVKGAVATTAIEGNTLTEEQARQVLEGELTLPPSQEYLGQEIRNVVEGCNAIVTDLEEGASGRLFPEDICRYNADVLRALPDLEAWIVPGEIRERSVGVAGYLAPPHGDVEHLLQRLCDWLNGPDFSPPNESWRLPLSILKAVVAHLYVAWIHPFGDGNGRTARLLELRLLLQDGVPMPAAHLLSNHYNQTRSAYYNRLAASSRTGPLPFVEYAVQGFVDGLREQLRTIRVQQLDDRWEQFVYESYGANSSPTANRQKRLVLALSRVGRPVARGDLRLLTSELAEAYATKTGKTLTRDVNALMERNLIRRTPQGFVPRRELLEAFLPAVLS